MNWIQRFGKKSGLLRHGVGAITKISSIEDIINDLEEEYNEVIVKLNINAEKLKSTGFNQR